MCSRRNHTNITGFPPNTLLITHMPCRALMAAMLGRAGTARGLAKHAFCHSGGHGNYTSGSHPDNGAQSLADPEPNGASEAGNKGSWVTKLSQIVVSRAALLPRPPPFNPSLPPLPSLSLPYPSLYPFLPPPFTPSFPPARYWAAEGVSVPWKLCFYVLVQPNDMDIFF